MGISGKHPGAQFLKSKIASLNLKQMGKGKMEACCLLSNETLCTETACTRGHVHGGQSQGPLLGLVWGNRARKLPSF